MAKTSKQLVIKHSLLLFKAQGYYSTSMADIGAACGLLKGSIYNYFSSKELLVVAVIQFVHEYFKENIFCYAYDNTRPLLERITLFNQSIEEYFTGQTGGCLMGNLALEVGDKVPLFSIRIKAYFDDWILAVIHLLESRCSIDQAKQFAETIVGNIQGAIMLTRIYDRPDFLKQANQSLVDLLNPNHDLKSGLAQCCN